MKHLTASKLPPRKRLHYKIKKEKNINEKHNMETDEMIKLPYAPPQLEVYEYVVERGFAESVRIYNNEELHEITDSCGNYHGEWF